MRITKKQLEQLSKVLLTDKNEVRKKVPTKVITVNDDLYLLESKKGKKGYLYYDNVETTFIIQVAMLLKINWVLKNNAPRGGKLGNYYNLKKEINFPELVKICKEYRETL